MVSASRNPFLTHSSVPAGRKPWRSSTTFQPDRSVCAASPYCLDREKFFIYICAADWSACLVAGENIDGKETGEAAGLDEKGHSETQDPPGGDNKNHGRPRPDEGKAGGGFDLANQTPVALGGY